MNKILSILAALCLCAGATASPIVTGDGRVDYYLPMLKGKRVAIVANNTAVVGSRHLVDTLLGRGVDIVKIFAPEHGFRGDIEAGANVASYKDRKTGIAVASIYGAKKKPTAEDMQGIDVVLFDIQDVGTRFYTYLSTMHYIMESCAENNIPLIVLDRPNPNGMYVDGPVLDMRYRSFVGMHPIPVVHGMTLGELAKMINGKGWLTGGARCELTVVECKDYRRSMHFVPPIKPSPNLPDIRAIYLYPSLCYFEATPVSIGRGTPYPFKVYGHPKLPKSGFGFAPTIAPQKGVECKGVDLRTVPSNDEVIAAGINLEYLISAYKIVGGERFFNSMLEKLIGVDYVRQMIIEGRSAAEIKARWMPDVEKFKQDRAPYLIYED